MQDLSHSINLEEISNVISRASLVTAVPGLTPPIWGDIEGVPLIHVKGLSSYWKNDGVVTYRKQMQDVISGLNGQGGDFYFLILGRNNQTNIFLGVGERKTSVDLVSILTGAFPGIILSAKKELNLGKRLEQEGFFRYRGRLSPKPRQPSFRGLRTGYSQPRYDDYMPVAPVAEYSQKLPETKYQTPD